MKRVYLFLVLLAALAVGAGCSSDPDTPLGSSFLPDSLIQSRPGAVDQDTIFIGFTDTTWVTNRFYSQLLTLPNKMTLGRADGFESTMLVRADFSTAGDDTAKTVSSALLTLPTDPDIQVGTLGALFYELLDPLTNTDTLTSLNLAPNAIPDSNGVNVDRTMRTFPRTYSLPDSLVQDWIRGNQPHNGIAIVLNDTTTTVELTFSGQGNANAAFLQVFFTDATNTPYNITASGTFTTDLSTSANLRMSDGDTRRIWMPVDLSAFNENVLLHQAKLVITVVPNSASEIGGFAELYAPKDSVIGSSGILTGTLVSSQALDTPNGIIEFPIRNIVGQFLADSTTNFGLAIRYLSEGSSARRIDFYSSAAVDTLRPSMRFTFSYPPTFPPDF